MEKKVYVTTKLVYSNEGKPRECEIVYVGIKKLKVRDKDQILSFNQNGLAKCKSIGYVSILYKSLEEYKFIKDLEIEKEQLLKVIKSKINNNLSLEQMLQIKEIIEEE